MADYDCVHIEKKGFGEDMFEMLIEVTLEGVGENGKGGRRR